MKIIGITGKSGSGKSTICHILEQDYNAEIIDADEVAKRLSQKGNVYFDSIVSHFGDSIINQDGALNRKELANIIFTDEQKRKELNELTFIYVVEEIKNTIKKLSHKNLIVIDASLLFESGLDQVCDFVIGIIAEEQRKIERICKRDNLTPQEAVKRLNTQKDDVFLKENSDYIIENNNETEDLREKIRKIVTI